MFPLVPDIISDELNLVVALLIGIAFGFVLEQAGFSSSRRLAGVFYGYDFTVLRVFFTAGITAMIGVIVLDYLGVLDTDFIYINPTYLWPAIVGGAIMGFGFIIGGYCPGTSVCAAAIGKIDAMFFVGGGLLGVFAFAEGFPLYEHFYTSSFFGDLRIFNSLGMSQGVFAFLLIVVAVLAFTLTTKLEKKINKTGYAQSFPQLQHKMGGILLIAIGIILVYLPTHKERLFNNVDKAMENSAKMKTMSTDELAFRIMDEDPRLQIIDVRDPSEFMKLPLPNAVNIPTEKLFGKEWSEILGRNHVKKVFIAEDESEAQRGGLLAEMLGYQNITVLHGGLKEFRAVILNYRKPALPATDGDKDADRFRSEASVRIAQLIKEGGSKAIRPPKLIKKVAGGC